MVGLERASPHPQILLGIKIMSRASAILEEEEWPKKFVTNHCVWLGAVVRNG